MWAESCPNNGYYMIFGGLYVSVNRGRMGKLEITISAYSKTY